jgi:hypothetical protein
VCVFPFTVAAGALASRNQSTVLSSCADMTALAARHASWSIPDPANSTLAWSAVDTGSLQARGMRPWCYTSADAGSWGWCYDDQAEAALCGAADGCTECGALAWAGRAATAAAVRRPLRPAPCCFWLGFTYATSVLVTGY